ncbi:MAG: cold-shock protein [Pseudomonadota bacterium]
MNFILSSALCCCSPQVNWRWIRHIQDTTYAKHFAAWTDHKNQRSKRQLKQRRVQKCQLVKKLTGHPDFRDTSKRNWENCGKKKMATGTVKWFNDAKGFGFIEPDGGGADVFAHFSAIAMEGFKTLKQGSRVTFEVTDGPKGQLAQNILAEPGQEAPQPIQTQDRQRHSKVRAPQFHATGHGHGDMLTK